MRLIPVDPGNEAHLKALYDLLAERPATSNISHKSMPTWEQHVAFVRKWGQRGAYPDEECYEAWYLLEEPSSIIGSVYLTTRNEIGVSVAKKERGLGTGPMAVKLLIEKHGPRTYLANVAPGNEASRKMFEKLGFKHIQNTYAVEAE